MTNEEASRKIQAAIGEYNQMVWPRFKVFWFCKTLKQATVKGQRKRDRLKKRWEDNIKEWTGMDFASSARAAENRTRWKGWLLGYFGFNGPLRQYFRLYRAVSLREEE